MSSARLLLLALLAGCDRNASDILPDYKSNLPPVVNIGEMGVLTMGEFAELQSDLSPWDWCEGATNGEIPGLEGEYPGGGPRRCIYGELGAPELGVNGGATFNFAGTGSEVCVIVDPEAVFWSASIAEIGRKDEWAYPDDTLDDGDIDMYGGLSSYYTGSPGIDLGDFIGFYTDSLGRTVEIDYSECKMDSGYINDVARGGRAAVEACTIDTTGREGVSFTVVLDTFSVPLNDGVLSFGAVVVDGPCENVPNGITECTLRGESQETGGGMITCSDRLEEAFCAENVQGFCCANPEMCNEIVPEGACEVEGQPFDRDVFCAENPTLCCENE